MRYVKLTKLNSSSVGDAPLLCTADVTVETALAPMPT